MVTKYSREYPGGSAKDDGERIRDGAHGEGNDGLCWERVGGVGRT